ncbi:MAG TPA: hypothetical protein VLA74_05600 [Nitrososphaeraceae archaeon]|nr:hypothetical protein [Nitrososphaeraceae archaeon]
MVEPYSTFLQTISKEVADVQGNIKICHSISLVNTRNHWMILVKCSSASQWL